MERKFCQTQSENRSKPLTKTSYNALSSQGLNLQLYQSVLHFFLDPTHVLLEQIGLEVLHNAPFRLFCNLCMVVALMLWAYQRVRLADFFFLRTFISLSAFALFFTLFNYATHNPSAFYAQLQEVFFYAPNVLTQIVQKSLQASSAAFSTDPAHFNLEFLLNQSFHSLVLLSTQAQAHLETFRAVFVLGLVLAQGGLLTYILALTLIISIELLLWLGLAVFILPLGLFAPLLVWHYGKKCWALAFYQPLILLLAFYNAQILQTLISTILPAPTAPTPKLAEAYLVLIVSTLLLLFLLRRVPAFLNGLFATQGGVQDLQTILKASKNAWEQHSASFLSAYTAQSNTHSQQESTQEPSFRVQTLRSPQVHIHNTKESHEIV